MDGKTPTSTPKTRTVPAHFFTGEPDGSVGYGDESWPIRKGVVFCPLEVGENASWRHATPEEAKAHDAALEAEKKSEAKTKAHDAALEAEKKSEAKTKADDKK